MSPPQFDGHFYAMIYRLAFSAKWKLNMDIKYSYFKGLVLK